MRDINQPCGDNLGGVLYFDFADVNDVESIPEVLDGAINDEVVLKTGCQWFKGYGTLGSIGYSETPEETAAGTLYKKNISCSSPKDGRENTSLFDEMKHKRFIVRYTDSNKLRKLIGTIEEPLKFSSSLNTKTNMPDLAGYVISFYGEGTSPSPVYNI